MSEIARKFQNLPADDSPDVIFVDALLSGNVSYYEVTNTFRNKLDGKTIHAFGGYKHNVQVYNNSAQWWKDSSSTWEDESFRVQEISKNTVRITANMNMRIRLLLIKC